MRAACGGGTFLTGDDVMRIIIIIEVTTSEVESFFMLDA
jgi:hypothetical protein